MKNLAVRMSLDGGAVGTVRVRDGRLEAVAEHPADKAHVEQRINASILRLAESGRTPDDLTPKDVLDDLVRYSKCRYVASLSDETGTAPVPKVTPRPVSTKGASANDEQPLAGDDGRALGKLVGQSKAYGVKVMSDIVASAVRRYQGFGPLLSNDDVKKLSGSLAAVRSTADLLARTRTGEKTDRARAYSSFADRPPDVPFATFADAPVGIMATPEDAVAFFMSRRPELGIDPHRYGEQQRRTAFTLAESSNVVLTQKIQDIVGRAFRGNRPDAETQAAIRDALYAAGVSPRNPQYSEMVFRTNVMDSFLQGTYEAGRAESETFPVWEYLIVDDERTGDDHRPKGGRYYPSDAPFSKVRGDRVYNCLLPGQLVQGEFSGGLESRYSGEVFEIETRSGSRIAVTVNHPVMTVWGFVPAYELREGHDLIRYRPDIDSDVLSVHKEEPPSAIEDVFHSLAKLFGRSRIAEVSALDLHGDAASCHSYINVVGSDVKLRFGVKTEQADGFNDGRFRRSLMGLFQIPRKRPFGLDLWGIFHSATRGVGRGHVSLPLFWGERLETLRFGPGSELDVVRPESTDQTGSVDADIPRDLLRRFTGKVTADRVVKIERRNFTGHVYDLQSKTGYFVSNATSISGGLIVSNCRCGMRWVDNQEWDELRGRGYRVESNW